MSISTKVPVKSLLTKATRSQDLSQSLTSPCIHTSHPIFARSSPMSRPKSRWANVCTSNRHVSISICIECMPFSLSSSIFRPYQPRQESHHPVPPSSSLSTVSGVGNHYPIPNLSLQSYRQTPPNLMFANTSHVDLHPKHFPDIHPAQTPAHTSTLLIPDRHIAVRQLLYSIPPEDSHSFVEKLDRQSFS